MGDTGVHVDSPNFTAIPILDFAQTTQSDTRKQFLAEFRNALVNVGFLYLKNPPVPTNVQENPIQKAKAMFDLSPEKKEELDMVNSKHFLGYTRLGVEKTAQKTDYREAFDWPSKSDIPGGRDAIEAYLSLINRLADDFKILIAEALDMGPTSLVRFFDNPPQPNSSLRNTLRQIPPSVKDQMPHSKGSGFIKMPIPVPPIPGTLVINIGRSLEAFTHAVCTATTHRVNLRSENYLDPVTKEPLGPRYSFPVFQALGLDLTRDQMALDIPPHIHDLVKEAHVKSDAEKFFNQIFQECIGEGSFTARLTAHPDVRRRWYPDVLERVLKGQKEFAG